jgi:hypothetical protein
MGEASTALNKSRRPVLGGAVAIGLIAITVFLPWVSYSGAGASHVPIRLKEANTGISSISGIAVLVISVGVAAFVVSSFVVPRLFPWGVLAGAGWSILAFLWLIVLFWVTSSDVTELEKILYATTLAGRAGGLTVAVGMGLYLAPLFALIAIGLFAKPAFAALREVRGGQA